MHEVETRIFEIEGLSGAKGPWTLQLNADQLTFASADHREVHSIRRGDVPGSITMTESMGRCYFRVKLPHTALFRVTPEVVEHFDRWRGPLTDADLRAALKHRMSWSMPIAAVWMLGSLPMGGDRSAGLAAIPLDPIGMTLGILLFALALTSRVRPRPLLFLLDAYWFGALAIDVTLDVVMRGDSALWLIVLPIAYWSIRDAYRHYQRFRNLAR